MFRIFVLSLFITTVATGQMCPNESFVQKLLAYSDQLKDHCYLDRLSEAQQDVLNNLKSLKRARSDKSSFGPTFVKRYESRLKLALENYDQIQNEDSRADQLKIKVKSPSKFFEYFLESAHESSTDVKDTLSLTTDRACKKAYKKIDKEKQSGQLSPAQIKELQAEAEELCSLR